jgi:ATP-binding cassette subfamily B protein
MSEEQKNKSKRAEEWNPNIQQARGPGGGGPNAGARGGYQRPRNAGKTFKRLFPYITRSRWLIVLVLLCVIVSTLGGVFSTYMLRPIINGLIGEGKFSDKISSLAFSLLGLGGLYLVSVLASYGQAALMAQLAHRGVNRIRGELFDKLQDLPLKFYDAHSHGELMSRFANDADNIQMCLEHSVTSLVSSAITLVGVITAMLITSLPLFPVTLITLAAAGIAFKVFGSKSRAYYRKQQRALGFVNGNIQEIIEGLRVVKAFTHEEKAKADFDELNERYFDAAKNANFYATALMPLTTTIMNIGYALTAAVGGVLTLLAGFDLGGLAAYLQYSRQVTQPLNMVSQQIAAILSALAGAERIFEIMDQEPETDKGQVTLVQVKRSEDGAFTESDSRTGHWAWKVPEEDGGSRLVELRGALRLTDVDFSYIPDKPILKKVSVYANPGQKIAFVGSTGAGKTTITNLINRFYEIDGGSITYDGIDIRDIKKESLRRSLGAVLQDTHLFTGTVMDNIRYGRLDATDEECVAAARGANAHSFIRRLPDGYQTMVTGDGANLSQGQRQLLAIARAAVADPPVMVLDEATSSIDTRTERHIERGMDALMQNRTVFVIAHRLSTVRNSNCIAVIENGEIQEKGDHGELLENKGRYYMLYTGQHVLD